MFEVGFELEIIKRWGRWISTTFHKYLWRGEQVMSNIGNGMMSGSNNGRAGGKRNRNGDVYNRVEHFRLAEISKCMSAVLRHTRLPGMTKQG